MHTVKTTAGQRFFLAYPVFAGDGMDTANKFYETLAECAVNYFDELTAADRCAVCRGMFTAEDDGSIITVRFTLTLRKGGKRQDERVLEHQWQKWDGRDAVLMR